MRVSTHTHKHIYTPVFTHTQALLNHRMADTNTIQYIRVARSLIADDVSDRIEYVVDKELNELCDRFGTDAESQRF